MINNEKIRMARIPIRSTTGLNGAKNPVKGKYNKAKPAKMEARNKKIIRSMLITPFVSYYYSVYGTNI
jgi:hypothetical protein